MGLDTIIEFENARIFQKDNLILTNVNLTINKGEFVYFIGKVGSGKSSLIKTINAEIPLKDGDGKVAGYDLKKLKTKQVPFLRRKLGIVFQDFQLLSDRSVHDNLQFVLKATGWTNKTEINDRIAQVLERVNLGYKGYKMPHQLSGGEQQRVVIARALLNEPEIILADEPTGNLDPETSENLMMLLLEISNNGRAVIMATHDYNMVKQFPARTIKFDNGKIFEQGLADEIDFESLKE
ncbi:MAG: phosphonate ABC transporter ATP-binding protein [Bacteroidetes bacterium GWC2_33_15]|nr:MAG: phosphonate ABC transporter ATP-binding protein [Bacteroidetes bacterium GWA2_33_15]OFX50961.1 MAG: phosphonate ABC transporter ATP-binding protein [Bacteroidetes bacterium GWC2_33_15]OFX66533.1 MAG: phosphonate ABC transporter ATP-binding protein [Bacteroidetes bacterium GWB2_32_14]OFX70187.1 MAG: phosphonate ABC transporter ATP-binding protein [Bacteroidetes bacterium GWD2_33_33]HAN19999.1 phosphonate ABC transporter ATP-binding protein [Bacteroidales bacterium]